MGFHVPLGIPFPCTSLVCSTDNTESGAKNYLTSYLAKTTMMWTCEGVDRSWWTQQNAGECLTVLLLTLQSALETRTLRHYFVTLDSQLAGTNPGHPGPYRAVITIESILADPAAVVQQLGSHFEKTEIFLNAMPDEAKSARDIISLLYVISCLCNIDAYSHVLGQIQANS